MSIVGICHIYRLRIFQTLSIRKIYSFLEFILRDSKIQTLNDFHSDFPFYFMQVRITNEIHLTGDESSSCKGMQILRCILVFIVRNKEITENKFHLQFLGFVKLWIT